MVPDYGVNAEAKGETVKHSVNFSLKKRKTWKE